MCKQKYFRCSVNEQLLAAGNDILHVLDRSQNTREFEVFVKGRLAAAAVEIFVGVERVIGEYKRHLKRYRLLDIALSPHINLHRADAKQLSVCKRARSPSLDQKEPELPHIKLEQEELWTSQEGEQIQGLNETDITVTSPVFDSETCIEKATTRSVSSGRSETKTERDDDWKEPGFNTRERWRKEDAKQLSVCKRARSPSLDQEEPELPHIKLEQEELCTSQEGEQIQGLNETDITVTSPVFIDSETCIEKATTRSVSSGRSETKTADRVDELKDPGNTGKRWRKEGSPSVIAGEDRMLQSCAVSGEKPYHCQHCDKSFSHLSSFRIHQRVHTGEKPYHCVECDKSFGHLSSLSMHKRVHTGEKPYHCQQCGKSFSQMSNLNKHKLIHTGEKPYHCQQCGKSYRQMSNLNKHKLLYTGEKPYQGQQCGKAFNQLSTLQYHQLVHTEGTAYQCQHCSRTFTYVESYRRHQRVHEEKPHHCQQCGKSFSLLLTLRVHQRVHTGEKPYLCLQCGKSFNQLANLNIHKLLHTGEKPHHCQQCGKSFSHLSGLRQHQRVHTGEKPYHCQQCGKSFSHLGSLKRHGKIHALIPLQD